jgi:lipid II:glycine glycyltransferase (peptidoglycan interpeptide bridge formation enzyme)
MKYGFGLKSEYAVDLQQDKESLIKNFSKNVRRENRKAIEQGFIFKECPPAEMLGHLIGLLKQTNNIRIAKGYKDYNYFYITGLNENTLKKLIDQNVIHFYSVERDSVLYSLQAVVEHSDRAYAILIGTSGEGYTFGLPSFMQYSLILRLRERNFKYLNFGGIPTDQSHKGLIHFKKSLGAVEHFSSYGSSSFLIFPFYFLNPIVFILRKLPENKFLLYFKKFVN